MYKCTLLFVSNNADKDEDNGQLDDPGIVLDFSPPNNIHYISWTSGIIITLFLTSLFFLIPQHNPLLEPFYWFEFPICIATGWMLIFTIAIMFECAYFANITYAKNLKSFCISYAQAAGTCLVERQKKSNRKTKKRQLGRFKIRLCYITKTSKNLFK